MTTETTPTTPTQCETPNCQGNTTEEDGSIGLWIDENGTEHHLCRACINKIIEELNSENH